MTRTVSTIFAVLLATIATGAHANDAELRLLKAQVALQRRQITKLQQDLFVKTARIAKLEAACRKAGIDPDAKPPKPTTAPSTTKPSPPPDPTKNLPAGWAASFDAARTLHKHNIDSVRQKLRTTRSRTTRKQLSDLLRKHLSSNGKPAVLSPLEVGRVGQLPYEQDAIVRQVVNPSEMIVEITVTVHLSARTPRRRPITKRVWMKGVPTTGLVDNSRMPTGFLFRVSGTKMYETVAGSSKTIFLLEPIDKSKWQGAYEAWCKATSAKSKL